LPMTKLDFVDGVYKTKESSLTFIAKLSPSFQFYRQILPIVFKASRLAKRGLYSDEEWCKSSVNALKALESAGVKFNIRGVDNFINLDVPCVFIGNHMSTLETFILPCIIAPYKKVTFVVKQSLVEYPVFKYVMRSRDPITVTRTNPRDDLKTVLEGGKKRLSEGVSIIIFPQTTRVLEFDPKEFNTIGIKLAQRANVPVVPIALKTDAWENGSVLKDFGKINPEKTVYFEFGKPLWIKDKGVEEHKQIINFIQSKLEEWKTSKIS